MLDEPDGKTVTAPVYSIDEYHRAAGALVPGIIAFGAGARLIATENPFDSMQRGSLMRQSKAKASA